MRFRARPEEATRTAANGYYYPNRMGRIVLTAMDDIMGRQGVRATLNYAGLSDRVDSYPPNNLELEFSFRELAIIQEAVEDLFGQHGGRALALRTGRETFKYALKDFMPILGIADLAFRPLHLGIKIKIGLEIFAETFNKFTDQVVRLSEESDRHLWIIERCPVCWQRTSERPCCHLAVGLLKESLNWVSNGREFQVREVECVATGNDACVIAIAKKPLS